MYDVEAIIVKKPGTDFCTRFCTSNDPLNLAVVTELCCHKINIYTKEKHIIQRILKC